MIFANIDYEQDYSDVHQELVEFIKAHFDTVDSGLQGDSWIWIYDGEDKVEIDTFSSMKHQIKCASKQSPLVDKIIDLLASKYIVHKFSQPELEPHEDE